MAINKVQLATYPDSLGGNLKSLNHVLQKYFKDTFKGGIHILPPFPSSGDRGFAPLTYTDIDPFFGTWEDIGEIGANVGVTLDLVLNHLSGQSPFFVDFLKNGRESEYADMFITLDKIWSDGKPDEDDIKKVFLRRTVPYSTFTVEKTGKQEQVWTTFGKTDPSGQIDLDINSPIVRTMFSDFFGKITRYNVRMVRLDALGYVIKKPGTSCFFVEPEIYHFYNWLAGQAEQLDIELIPEIHSHYSVQLKLASKGIWIYDFILPYMILDSLLNHSGDTLCEYLRARPHKQITMLDCHDGIPVKPDLDDLISSADAQKIVDVCMQRGANLSRVLSDRHKSYDGFDVHQIRCSYYSVLDCNDDAYLAARAIQLFAPGIPQVYYVGLLAGKNDTDNVLKTGEGREINRHNYTIEEIDQAVQSPVVRRLLQLIRFRNDYPAFDGHFKVANRDAKHFAMIWEKDNYQCRLEIDLMAYTSLITYLDDKGQTIYYNV
jgi:sucrose phosphorylase